MRVAVLNSGSNGNSTLIEEDGKAILVDCGISMKQCLLRVDELAGEVELLGILVTHEHTDHVGSVGRLARRLGITAYATLETREAAGRHMEGVRTIHVEPFLPFDVGPFHITPIPVLHDAANPTGYHVTTGGNGLTVVSDMGCMTDDVRYFFERSSAVILESNHDAEMLMKGVYTAALKARIRGPLGHMSNEDAGRAIAESGPAVAFLAHLSQNNNSRETARETVEGILAKEGVTTDIYVTRRDGPTELVEVPDIDT